MKLYRKIGGIVAVAILVCLLIGGAFLTSLLNQEMKSRINPVETIIDSAALTVIYIFTIPFMIADKLGGILIAQHTNNATLEWTSICQRDLNILKDDNIGKSFPISSDPLDLIVYTDLKYEPESTHSSEVGNGCYTAPHGSTNGGSSQVQGSNNESVQREYKPLAGATYESTNKGAGYIITVNLKRGLGARGGTMYLTPKGISRDLTDVQ